MGARGLGDPRPLRGGRGDPDSTVGRRDAERRQRALRAPCSDDIEVRVALEVPVTTEVGASAGDQKGAGLSERSSG